MAKHSCYSFSRYLVTSNCFLSRSTNMATPASVFTKRTCQCRIPPSLSGDVKKLSTCGAKNDMGSTTTLSGDPSPKAQNAFLCS